VNVGIGLPNTTPGADGDLIVEWARRADAGPFSSLATLDRLVYESLEPFAVLAAAAAVTERVRLATMIAIGPVRNTAVLAKQAQTINSLADGRLTLGLAVGARLDDYEAASIEHRGRGPRLSAQLAHLRSDDRPGRPRLWGQAYFALGDIERGNAYLRDYYAFTGPFADRIVAANLTSGRAIKDLVRGYAEEGCDELVLLPTLPDIAELDRLAEVLA
jgi:hypothetical protein